MKTVYLAGPITGLTFDGAADWRDKAITELSKHGIHGLSPLRAKEYLRNVGPLTASCEGYEELSCLSSPRGIVTRDRRDATTSDVLIANFLGAKKVSIGTVMELGWADLSRVPIVGVMEKHGNPHDHAMVTEVIGFRVTTVDEAIEVTKAILDQSYDPPNAYRSPIGMVLGG